MTSDNRIIYSTTEWELSVFIGCIFPSYETDSLSLKTPSSLDWDDVLCLTSTWAAFFQSRLGWGVSFIMIFLMKKHAFPDEKTEIKFSKRKLKFCPKKKISFLPEKPNRWSPTTCLEAPAHLTLQEGINLMRHSARKMSLLRVHPNRTRSKFLSSHFFEIFVSFHAAETPFSSQLHPWALAPVLAMSFSVTQVMLLCFAPPKRGEQLGPPERHYWCQWYISRLESQKSQNVIPMTTVSPLGELPKPSPSCSLG